MIAYQDNAVSNVEVILECEISGSYGGVYEDVNLLGCCAV
jgi:hypothetical protein